MLNKAVLKRLVNPGSIVWWFETHFFPKISVRLRYAFPSVFLGETQKGKILVFHIGRSGSTVLGDLLNQDRGIFWDGEVAREYFGDASSSSGCIDDFKEIFSKRQVLSGKRRWYGCEIKFFHLEKLNWEIKQFLADCVESGFTHFVVLERKNYFRKIISSLLASSSGVWHQAKSESPRKKSIFVDVDRVNIDENSDPLLRTLEKYDSQFSNLKAAFDELSVPNIWISYEDDLLPNPIVAYKKICQFLSKKTDQVSVRYGRTNPFPINEMVENMEEVTFILKGTPFEWMLEEVK